MTDRKWTLDDLIARQNDAPLALVRGFVNDMAVLVGAHFAGSKAPPQRKLDEWINWLAEEVVELQDASIAAKNGSKEAVTHVFDELGDVIHNCFAIMYAMANHDDRDIHLSRVLSNVVRKLERRRPWVFPGYEKKVPPTAEAEDLYWREVARIEKLDPLKTYIPGVESISLDAIFSDVKGAVRKYLRSMSPTVVVEEVEKDKEQADVVYVKVRVRTGGASADPYPPTAPVNGSLGDHTVALRASEAFQPNEDGPAVATTRSPSIDELLTDDDRQAMKQDTSILDDAIDRIEPIRDNDGGIIFEAVELASLIKEEIVRRQRDLIEIKETLIAIDEAPLPPLDVEVTVVCYVDGVETLFVGPSGQRAAARLVNESNSTNGPVHVMGSALSRLDNDVELPVEYRGVKHTYDGFGARRKMYKAMTLYGFDVRVKQPAAAPKVVSLEDRVASDVDEESEMFRLLKPVVVAADVTESGDPIPAEVQFFDNDVSYTFSPEDDDEGAEDGTGAAYVFVRMALDHGDCTRPISGVLVRGNGSYAFSEGACAVVIGDDAYTFASWRTAKEAAERLLDLRYAAHDHLFDRIDDEVRVVPAIEILDGDYVVAVGSCEPKADGATVLHAHGDGTVFRDQLQPPKTSRQLAARALHILRNEARAALRGRVSYTIEDRSADRMVYLNRQGPGYADAHHVLHNVTVGYVETIKALCERQASRLFVEEVPSHDDLSQAPDDLTIPDVAVDKEVFEAAQARRTPPPADDDALASTLADWLRDPVGTKLAEDDDNKSVDNKSVGDKVYILTDDQEVYTGTLLSDHSAPFVPPPLHAAMFVVCPKCGAQFDPTTPNPPPSPGLPIERLDEGLKMTGQTQDRSGAEVAKFLHESGLLFEINRKVLHPLGFALGVIQKEDGSFSSQPLLFENDDPAGRIYSQESLDRSHAKYSTFFDEHRGLERFMIRLQKHGFVVQGDDEGEVVRAGSLKPPVEEGSDQGMRIVVSGSDMRSVVWIGHQINDKVFSGHGDLTLVGDLGRHRALITAPKLEKGPVGENTVYETPEAFVEAMAGLPSIQVGYGRDPESDRPNGPVYLPLGGGKDADKTDDD